MTRRDWTCLLLGAVFATAWQAWSGPEIQIELGQCRFGLANSGTFYEEEGGYDHQNYMTPRCGGIGLADKFKDSSFGWRIAAVRTGNIQARSNVARYGDDQNRQPCDPATTIGCKASFTGAGYTYGVSFGLTDEHRVGDLRVIGEVGLFFFRHAFQATAVAIDSGAGGEQHYAATSSWTAPPAPLLGLTVRYGNLYMAMRHYFAAGHRELSLTDHSMTQYIIGLAFPL